MAKKRRGFFGNIYRISNLTGLGALPAAATFVQLRAAMDIKLSDSWKTWDASDRGSIVMMYLPGQAEWSLEFSVIWDQTDPELVILQNSYRSSAAIPFWVADGVSTNQGSSGPVCQWLITDFPKDMPLADGMKISVKCVPHGSRTFEPGYFTVGVAGLTVPAGGQIN